LIEQDGSLVYCKLDQDVKKICEKARVDIQKFPYAVPENSIENGLTSLIIGTSKIPLQIFGEHNLMNLNGALLICNQLGLSNEQFYSAIQLFKGASKRLELVRKNDKTAVYKDFAHSPSKLKATTLAVKNQFPKRKLIACMELHSFSSLNEIFLKQYEDSMSFADEAIVYYNPHTIEHKKLKAITEEQVKNAFKGNNLKVYTNSKQLQEDLLKMNFKNKNLLMMSSGNFDGIDFKELGRMVVKK
jgi:UDP-N-acetylmuramate: L-alanyl-gamma-D-glutamyl-meso-diaminopimelate ligase